MQNNYTLKLVHVTSCCCCCFFRHIQTVRASQTTVLSKSTCFSVVAPITRVMMTQYSAQFTVVRNCHTWSQTWSLMCHTRFVFVEDMEVKQSGDHGAFQGVGLQLLISMVRSSPIRECKFHFPAFSIDQMAKQKNHQFLQK